MWDYEAADVKEDGERVGGRICVKRTETVLRGRLRGRGRILVS